MEEMVLPQESPSPPGLLATKFHPPAERDFDDFHRLSSGATRHIGFRLRRTARRSVSECEVSR